MCVQHLCKVAPSLSQLPADIADAGRKREEMGIAGDKQPE